MKILSKINIIITYEKNKPAIELRLRITDSKLIQRIIEKVWSKEPLTLMPVFTNELRSFNSLQEKGIIYIEEEKIKFNKF
jgi:hypothetical protein